MKTIAIQGLVPTGTGVGSVKVLPPLANVVPVSDETDLTVTCCVLQKVGTLHTNWQLWTFPPSTQFAFLVEGGILKPAITNVWKTVLVPYPPT